jgi:hypothetical protein
MSLPLELGLSWVGVLNKGGVIWFQFYRFLARYFGPLQAAAAAHGRRPGRSVGTSHMELAHDGPHPHLGSAEVNP